MRRFFTAASLLLVSFLCGCQGYPRYRGGTEDVPPDQKPKLVRYGQDRADRLDTLHVLSTTDDQLRFGSILQSYLGRPYAGTSAKDPGFDCSDFTMTAYMQYNRTDLPRTAEDQARVGDPVQFNRLSFGDLIFFHTEGKAISHVGIYLGGSRFIHASSSYGIIISRLTDRYWSERYVEARRIFK